LAASTVITLFSEILKFSKKKIQIRALMKENIEPSKIFY
jgi:hypothetical protein